MDVNDFDPHGGAADDVNQTNGIRAARVFEMYESNCDDDERPTDLLADLQHLAHREGWDFAAALNPHGYICACLRCVLHRACGASQ